MFFLDSTYELIHYSYIGHWLSSREEKKKRRPWIFGLQGRNGMLCYCKYITFPDKYPQCWPNQNPGGESWLHGSTRPPMARTGPRPHWGSSLPTAAGMIYQPIAPSIKILSKIQFPFCWSLDWVKVIWPTAVNSIWLFNVTPLPNLHFQSAFLPACADGCFM